MPYGPNSGQRIADADWFVDPGRFPPVSADRMNACIHTEQRLKAMNKMSDTPLGPEYLEALAVCVRLNAQLGFVDAGIPMARQLAELMADGRSSAVAAGAYCDLGAMAHACRTAHRFHEALELDTAAGSWFAGHRAEFGEYHVAAVAGLAADHAGLDDLGGAVAVLRAELDDPRSPVRLHPLGRQAVDFVGQLKRYERQVRIRGHEA